MLSYEHGMASGRRSPFLKGQHRIYARLGPAQTRLDLIRTIQIYMEAKSRLRFEPNLEGMVGDAESYRNIC